MLFNTRSLLLLLITAPLLALATWFPFMQWVAWGYALVILAMIYTDWRMAGKITQFDHWRGRMIRNYRWGPKIRSIFL